MIFPTPFQPPKSALNLFLAIGCASLLSACGGDDDNKNPKSDYSSSQSSSNSSVVSSATSSLAVSSSAPSNSATSSSAISASSISSVAVSSSSAPSAPPVAWVDAQLNSADGNYMVAKGNAVIALPEDTTNTSFKPHTVDRTGFALYTFAKDTKDTSNCSGACLATWPALLATAQDVAAAPYTIIERSLGNGTTARQWAYQGLPLYFFKNDTAAGQTNGKAVANWQLARPIPVGVQQDATKGSYLIGKGLLVNSEGMADQSKAGFTLYTFAKDTANQSNCGATCIANWPPLYAAAEAQSAGEYSVVTRSDNKRQWAYKGQPLYFYAGDSAAGEIKGEITNWALATPTAASSSAASSSTASSVLSATSSSSSKGYVY